MQPSSPIVSRTAPISRSVVGRIVIDYTEQSDAGRQAGRQASLVAQALYMKMKGEGGSSIRRVLEV